MDVQGRPYTVSEITAQVKRVLEESLSLCWVVGEISDYIHHSSGHRYFTLKDQSSQLSAVLFKGQARHLAFNPQPGMQVMAYGNISVYERGGRYQFYVLQLHPAGIGELSRAFEQLKKRLETEGLFAADHKRPLPPYPQTIGIVTSPTGAAIRDIVQVLQRRAPGLQLVLRPASVQGAAAAAEIAQAIADLNHYPGIDILIVGRGGGSPEDLWPFNEEVVARAIYQSALPIISAVGHEIDYTIADYVADYRAPTPSAAAEIVAQDRTVLLGRVIDRRRRLEKGIGHLLDYYQQRWLAQEPQRLLHRLQDYLAQRSQYIDERRHDLAHAFDWSMHTYQQSLRTALIHLQALSPLASLARGFTLCHRSADDRLVRTSQDLQPGDRIRLRFHRGGAVATVEETEND